VRERVGSAIPGGRQIITYTPFDLPQTITTGTGVAALTTHFEYTADGTRAVRRDIDATRHFVSDLYERLATPNGATLEERFRIHAGERAVGEIVRKNGADQTLYFHTDALDSVDTITTDSGVVAHQTFDLFGTPVSAPTPELTRAGFTGHAHDRDLGLVDMRGRVYDPLAGRFMTADPVMQAPHSTQGLNRYSYVFNDPVNHVDPSGYFAILPGYPAGAVITGGGGLAAGLGGNLGSTLGGGLQGLGSAGHGPRAVAAGGVAPSASGVGQGTTHAVGQNKGGVGPLGPPVKGPRDFSSSKFAQEGRTCPEQGCFDERVMRGDEFLLMPIINGLGEAWRWLFGQSAVRAAPTAAELLRPAGMDNAAFGKIIGWTRSGTLEQNLAQTRVLIKELPSRIGALRNAGVTKQMAQQWADFYRAEAARVATNPNALPRSQLMQAIADLL
jgi:RHS repeat-associated protein